MKKILCLIIMSMLIFLTGCSKKQEKTQVEKIIERDILIVGVSTHAKPFGFIDKKTGKNEGFDVDIAKIIAKEMLGSERKIKYVPVTPAKRIEAITSGEVDCVIATMSVTPQRLLLVDFSEPYYVAGQTALVRKDSNIYNFADLKKKKTIVVLGTTSERNIRQILPTAQLIGYKSYDEAFEAFKEGYADAYSNDNTILSGYLTKDCEFRLLKNKISHEPYAIGIKRNEKDDSLKKYVNIIIKRIQKDGTILQLKKKWNLK